MDCSTIENTFITMKKMFFFLAVCGVSLSAAATDTILTKQLQRIEASVLKVTDDSVMYRLPNSADDAILSLSKADIESLLLENGVVLQFSDVKPKKSEKNIVFADGNFRWEKNNSVIAQADYERLLQNSCIVAWEQYRKGEKLQNVGKLLLSFGVVTTVGGVVAFATKAPFIGAGMMAGGLSLLGAGIPVFCVGKTLYRNSYEPYNEQCVSLNVYPSGVGLAWSF